MKRIPTIINSLALIFVFYSLWSHEQSHTAPIQAPQTPPKTLSAPEQRITFEDLLDAIEQVESGGDANAKGDKVYLWTFLEDAEHEEYARNNPNNIFVEAGSYGPYTYRAIGAYQIHKIYVDDVNRILHSYPDETIYLPNLNYTYEDRWNKYKSRQMASIYIRHYWSKNCTYKWPGVEREHQLEDMARIHNGGPNGWKKDCTKKYWEKVKKYLEVSR